MISAWQSKAPAVVLLKEQHDAITQRLRSEIPFGTMATTDEIRAQILEAYEEEGLREFAESFLSAVEAAPRVLGK
jgi:hypothetical protein